MQTEFQPLSVKLLAVQQQFGRESLRIEFDRRTNVAGSIPD
jgi:hypothetical protein